VKTCSINLRMIYIGIDFSINSPGICIWSDLGQHYDFISLPAPKLGTKREQALQDELAQLEGVHLERQPPFQKGENWSKRELLKLKLWDDGSQRILDLISPLVQGKGECFIGFEGTSYGSKMRTNNLIDSASGAAILKVKMWQRFRPVDLVTLAPSTIKKFAGGGAWNKSRLFEAFLNPTGDPHIRSHPLWKISKDIGPVKKVPKPIDDLVDAYFLVNYLKESVKKC
jgi:hypothetical protein